MVEKNADVWMSWWWSNSFIIISSALNALMDDKPIKEELSCEKIGDLVIPSSLFTDLANGNILLSMPSSV